MTSISGAGPSAFHATRRPSRRPAVAGDRTRLGALRAVTPDPGGARPRRRFAVVAIRLWPVFLVLVVALLVAGTLSPAVRWLEERRVKRGLESPWSSRLFHLRASRRRPHDPEAGVAGGDALRARARAPRATGGHPRPLSCERPARDLASETSSTTRSSAGIGATAFAFSLRVVETTAYGLSALFLALYIMIDRDRSEAGSTPSSPARTTSGSPAS